MKPRFKWYFPTKREVRKVVVLLPILIFALQLEVVAAGRLVVAGGRMLQVNLGSLSEELREGHLLVADVLHGVIEGIHRLREDKLHRGMSEKRGRAEAAQRRGTKLSSELG